MCELIRTLLQGSLGHQAFTLLFHLCWGEQRKERVANCTVFCVPIGAPQQSTVPLQLTGIISVTPLEAH